METRRRTQAEDGRLLRALAELANSQSEQDVQRFIARYPKFLERQAPAGCPTSNDPFQGAGLVQWGLRVRDHLQNIWRRGPRADDDLTEILFDTFSRLGGLEHLFGDTAGKGAMFPIGADLSRRRLSYRPETDLHKACYFLLQNADRAKVCGNPECPAPYFVARKAIQRYCSPDCLKVFQQQWSRDWWERVGKFRRARKTTPKKDRRADSSLKGR